MYMQNITDKIPGAPNFTYREFIKSQTALRKGIRNVPTIEQWENVEKLAKNILQPIRTNFGRIRITSGFRSVELCEAIGSSSTSNHAKGQAADIEPVDTSIKLFDILEWIHDNLVYRELIAEYFPRGWIHVAFRDGANTKVLKLKDSNHHYSRVSIDYIRNLYS